mmetsp:Transcript_1037/g.2008  ORF Transcript_1037/g.2008 Transcript_1037/m.2008 type:complete len:252 (+) Transcript_1037:1032-1787(+)
MLVTPSTISARSESSDCSAASFSSAITLSSLCKRCSSKLVGVVLCPDMTEDCESRGCILGEFAEDCDSDFDRVPLSDILASIILNSCRSFHTLCCSCFSPASASSARFSAAARSWISCSRSLPLLSPIPGPDPICPSIILLRRRSASAWSRSFVISRLWLWRSSERDCAFRSAPSLRLESVRIISASLRWSCSSACKLRRSAALSSISRRAFTSCLRNVLLLSSNSVTLRAVASLSSSIFIFVSESIWTSR